MGFSPKLREIRQPLLPCAPDKADYLKEKPMLNFESKKTHQTDIFLPRITLGFWVDNICRFPGPFFHGQ
jgi:hypothetical protein